MTYENLLYTTCPINWQWSCQKHDVNFSWGYIYFINLPLKCTWPKNMKNKWNVKTSENNVLFKFNYIFLFIFKTVKKYTILLKGRQFSFRFHKGYNIRSLTDYVIRIVFYILITSNLLIHFEKKYWLVEWKFIFYS